MASSEVIEVKCPSCKAINRVSRIKVDSGLKPKCGKCKELLPMAKEALVVTDATFEQEVEKSSLPVLLDCWAPWCGPCRMLAPTIEELAEEMDGTIKVAKLNVDDNPKTASKFGIMSIPTLLVFKGGEIVDRMVGVQPKASIKEHLKDL
ncbi:thioredoxin [Candidatus Poribacteria bacterium]|nr:thioredoxin [Candidatus Poribacteria bacterium]